MSGETMERWLINYEDSDGRTPPMQYIVAKAREVDAEIARLREAFLILNDEVLAERDTAQQALQQAHAERDALATALREIAKADGVATWATDENHISDLITQRNRRQQIAREALTRMAESDALVRFERAEMVDAEIARLRNDYDHEKAARIMAERQMQQAHAERDALAAALRVAGACGVGIRDCAEYTATGTHIPELAGILTDIAKQGGLIDQLAREALTRMGETEVTT